MYPGIEPTLLIDIQAQRPVCRCQCCGGARYAPEDTCLRCERRAP